METKNRRKPRDAFLISNKDNIDLLYEHQLNEGYNPLVLLAPTGRKDPLPSFTNTNWKEATTPRAHALTCREDTNPQIALTHPITTLPP